MNTIDFSPTAYTVKHPGNGREIRYEATMYPQMVGAAARVYTQLVDQYPNLAQFVVPDHFVQEYCRAYESGLYGGSRGFSVDDLSPFLRLAEVGARQAKFS